MSTASAGENFKIRYTESELRFLLTRGERKTEADPCPITLDRTTSPLMLSGDPRGDSQTSAQRAVTVSVAR